MFVNSELSAHYHCLISASFQPLFHFHRLVQCRELPDHDSEETIAGYNDSGEVLLCEFVLKPLCIRLIAEGSCLNCIPGYPLCVIRSVSGLSPRLRIRSIPCAGSWRQNSLGRHGSAVLIISA